MEKEKNVQAFDNFLFPRIFETFRVAINFKNLIIGLGAITVICLVGKIMDAGGTVAATSAGGRTITELHVYLSNPDQVASFIEQNKDSGKSTGVFTTLWRFAGKKFHAALNALFKFDLPGVASNIGEYFRGVGWALKHHSFYCLLFGVIKLAVITIAGGSICRIAALRFARGEKAGLSEVLRYSTSRFLSFFMTPLAPAAIIIFFGFCIFLLGLIGTVPGFGELITALLMPLVLVAGALITIVLIGTAAGFNLMFPAIAYEGSDCFDAISRSFSYVYNKPWRMGFYTAVAGVYGAICYVFVRFFAFVLLWSSRQSLTLGARLVAWFVGLFGAESRLLAKFAILWPEPSFTNLLGTYDLAAANWTQSAASIVIYLFLQVIIGLVVAFIISFYFSANTMIYSLMRNRMDNTALDEVFTPGEPAELETAAGEQEPEQTEPGPEDEAKPEGESETVEQ